jgi:hypothetical protein
MLFPLSRFRRTFFTMATSLKKSIPYEVGSGSQGSKNTMLIPCPSSKTHRSSRLGPTLVENGRLVEQARHLQSSVRHSALPHDALRLLAASNSVDPEDDQEICQMADLDSHDVREAINAAQAAFATYSKTTHCEGK